MTWQIVSLIEAGVILALGLWLWSYASDHQYRCSQAAYDHTLTGADSQSMRPRLARYRPVTQAEVLELTGRYHDEPSPLALPPTQVVVDLPAEAYHTTKVPTINPFVNPLLVEIAGVAEGPADAPVRGQAVGTRLGSPPPTSTHRQSARVTSGPRWRWPGRNHTTAVAYGSGR